GGRQNCAVRVTATSTTDQPSREGTGVRTRRFRLLQRSGAADPKIVTDICFFSCSPAIGRSAKVAATPPLQLRSSERQRRVSRKGFRMKRLLFAGFAVALLSGCAGPAAQIPPTPAVASAAQPLAAVQAAASETLIATADNVRRASLSALG